MINEVDEALRSLVRADVVRGGDIEVLFDAPTRDWASRRNTPTIGMYLYDVREDVKRRSTGMVERRNDEGIVVERQALPRYFKLAYLVTAWTQRPEDEHRLLSAVLACFMRHDTLPDTYLTPALATDGFPIGVQIAYPPPDDRQVSDVWSSVGGDLKPSVDLVVTVPMRPDRLYEIAQSVMRPLRLRAGGYQTSDAVDDEHEGRERVPVAAANGHAVAADGAPEGPAPAAGGPGDAGSDNAAPGGVKPKARRTRKPPA
jgi:hypothetical protein